MGNRLRRIKRSCGALFRCFIVFGESSCSSEVAHATCGNRKEETSRAKRMTTNEARSTLCRSWFVIRLNGLPGRTAAKYRDN